MPLLFDIQMISCNGAQCSNWQTRDVVRLNAIDFTSTLKGQAIQQALDNFTS